MINFFVLLYIVQNISSCEVLNITVYNGTESSYVKRCCNVESTGVSIYMSVHYVVCMSGPLLLDTLLIYSMGTSCIRCTHLEVEVVYK